MTGLVRGISFTGSFNGARRNAIPSIVERFGDYLLAIPQGEEERPNWIVPIVERTHALPGMAQEKPGSFRNYMDVPQYRYTPKEGLYIPHSVLSIAGEASAAADVLFGLFGGGPDKWGKQLQVGVPFASDHARFSLVPEQAEVLMPAFVHAMTREIELVRALLDDHVSIWLESPGSLLQMDTAAQSGVNLEQMATVIAGEFAAAVSALRPGASITIHLCRGDLNHTSWFKGIRSLEPMVTLANALYRSWPHDHATLKGIHLPTCAADVPPRTDREFFRPLSDLDIGLPVILGNVHEIVSLEDVPLDTAVLRNLHSLEAATEAYGREFMAVSLSCGCARMKPEQYTVALDVMEGLMQVEGIYHR